MIHTIGLIGIAIVLTLAMVGMAVTTLVSAFSRTDYNDKKIPEIRITDEWVSGGGHFFRPLIYRPIEEEK